jgi:hypothetical protein
MKRYAHIKDGIVVNVSVWEGEQSADDMVCVDGVWVTVGMTYCNGSFDEPVAGLMPVGEMEE